MEIEKDSNREAFEAFFYENCMFQWEQDLSEMFFQVLENNEYDYARVQSSWLSWQAAKAQADAPGHITLTYERLQELIAIGVKAAQEQSHE